MAHVSKATKHNEDYSWVIRSVMYRCKISVIDWKEHIEDYTEKPDRARYKITVFVLPNHYDKHTAFSIAGECVYNGISLKEAWDEVKSYCGKVQMPDELKKLQPFIAQQT